MNTATLSYMETSHRDTIAYIVRAEIGARGWTAEEAAPRLRMSPSTLNRIYAGQSVGLIQYRKLERVLGLPPFLFDYILAGDKAAIQETHELSSSMRRRIIELMSGHSDGNNHSAHK